MLFDDIWCILMIYYIICFSSTYENWLHKQTSVAMSKSLANHPARIVSFPGTCFWNHVPSVIYPLKRRHCRKLDFEKLMLFFFQNRVGMGESWSCCSSKSGNFRPFQKPDGCTAKTSTNPLFVHLILLWFFLGFSIATSYNIYIFLQHLHIFTLRSYLRLRVPRPNLHLPAESLRRCRSTGAEEGRRGATFRRGELRRSVRSPRRSSRLW